nr:immunoglobulin heavy chain junction region [Macaca mulatta]
CARAHEGGFSLDVW